MKLIQTMFAALSLACIYADADVIALKAGSEVTLGSTTIRCERGDEGNPTLSRYCKCESFVDGLRYSIRLSLRYINGAGEVVRNEFLAAFRNGNAGDYTDAQWTECEQELRTHPACR